MLSLLAAYVVYLITANRMSLSYHIGHAIAHREFRVYCQPIINSDNGRCVGVETLMRWKNKRQGWISPDVFIPLAEQHALIIPLTRYLMTTVVENLNLFPLAPLSISASTSQQSISIPSALLMISAASGCPPIRCRH